jgi:hypothetical protein
MENVEVKEYVHRSMVIEKKGIKSVALRVDLYDDRKKNLAKGGFLWK